MSCTGFGICGHKNSYSNSTKCGNWVEDRIGKATAAYLQNAERPNLGSTVVRDDFVHPGTMPGNAALCGNTAGQMFSAADIKDKNRNGVSFDLLFGHVKDPHHAKRLHQ
ncbi:unnamed protein product, partial [Choristocarpus tenellus]